MIDLFDPFEGTSHVTDISVGATIYLGHVDADFTVVQVVDIDAERGLAQLQYPDGMRHTTALVVLRRNITAMTVSPCN
jgi:hypothetical protein